MGIVPHCSTKPGPGGQQICLTVAQKAVVTIKIPVNCLFILLIYAKCFIYQMLLQLIFYTFWILSLKVEIKAKASFRKTKT